MTAVPTHVDASALDRRLSLARNAARLAGDVLMDYFGHLRAGGVRKKGAVDLVTEADEAAEAVIRERVLERCDDAFLGEEGGITGPEDATWTWVVDPLDGTTNFAHGLEHFAVSVAAVVDGVPLVGVIEAPALNLGWYACAGQGAFDLDDRPIAVSDTDAPIDALVATGFPYDRQHTADELLEPVRRALEQCRGVRRAGAAALDLANVARGALDAYWEPRLKPWDMAAGVLLVREAGGQVSSYGDAPWHLDADTLVASNGALHDAIVRLVGPG